MLLLFLKINQINIGAPIKEVTIPTGISEGEIIILAIESDISKNIPPNNMLPNIEYLWSEPKINLEILGTISPTNEIIPAIETADAANIEVNIIDTYCNLFVFKPKETESSFPSESTLNSFDNNIDKIIPDIIIGNVEINSIQPFPDKPPLSQKIM